MEENKKSNIGLIIILVVLVLALGAYIAYDKLLRKSNSEMSANSITTVTSKNNSELSIDDLLSLIYIKGDGDKIYSYKTGDLTDRDINDFICYYLVFNGTFDEDNHISKAKTDSVESIINNVYGIEIQNINLSSGISIRNLNLSKKIIDGGNYYVLEQVENNELMGLGGYFFETSYEFGKIKKVSYKKDILSIECDIQRTNSQTPSFYELLGDVTIQFDMSNGIKFVSLDFKAANIVETYSQSPIME